MTYTAERHTRTNLWRAIAWTATDVVGTTPFMFETKADALAAAPLYF
jgi:hypothetical protein